MRKTNKIILFTLIIVVLLLGVGYAAIQNVTLNITGTAAADPSQSNFKVMFTGTPAVSDPSYVVAAITDDINATINVAGLTTKGQTVTATYTVQNVSTDLSADLSVATVNNNAEYFKVTSELEKTSLIAGEATILTMTVELIKTPLTEVRSTIGMQLTAMPVQPGEEGTSEGINGSSTIPENKTTLSLVTNDNIGDYIDLGSDILDYDQTTGITTDDWRILYVDNDNVYAILSGVIPEDYMTSYISFQSLGGEVSTIATNSVLTYTANSDNLINLLNNGAFSRMTKLGTVCGAPSVEMIINSYNANNGTNYDINTIPNFHPATCKDFDLYITQKGMPSTTPNGYWTTTKADYNSVWVVSCQMNKFITNTTNTSVGNYLRPVVTLPKSLTCEVENGVWVVD